MTERDLATEAARHGDAGAVGLSTALADLRLHGWHVLAGLAQTGNPGPRRETILVGPGGVLVLEAAEPGSSSSLGEVTALVPAQIRRHVLSVVCSPKEEGVSETAGGPRTHDRPKGDAEAGQQVRPGIHVRPGVLAAFARSLPEALDAESAAAVTESLKSELTQPSAEVWTADKVLEWTKKVRAHELTVDSPASASIGQSVRGRALRIPRKILFLVVAVILVIVMGILAQGNSASGGEAAARSGTQTGQSSPAHGSRAWCGTQNWASQCGGRP